MAISSIDRKQLSVLTFQEQLKPYMLAVLFSILGAILLFVTHGNLFIIPALCVVLVFLFLLMRYLELGVYTLLCASLLLEQFQIFGIKDIVTQKIPFFLNLNLTTGIGALKKGALLTNV